jgi:hypothetical protein
MFTTTIEMIEVKTFEQNIGRCVQRDIIQVECWFTALAFVKDAAQAGLRSEVKSWEVEIQRNK